MDPKVELWVQGLRQGWSMHCRPLGQSMIPNLRQGDLVKVTPEETYRLGDIILVNHGGHYIMHRVVVKSDGWIITKGDASTCLDPPVSPREILGRVVSRNRRGKESSLDSPWARWVGLAFCLTVSWLFAIRGAVNTGAERRLACLLHSMARGRLG